MKIAYEQKLPVACAYKKVYSHVAKEETMKN